MTRAMIRVLLTRAGILFLVTMAFLLSMNFSTNRRLAAEKQESYRETFGTVLPADRYDEISLAGFREEYPTVRNAYTAYTNNTLTGYVVEVLGSTAEAEILTRMGFSADGKTLLALQVIPQEGNGEGIAESSFRQQFQNIRVPAALLADLPDVGSETYEYPAVAGLNDGTFREMLSEADESGYRDYVEIVVQNGRIVAVTWDAVQTDGGKNRAKASVNGEYVIDDSDVLWAVQAYAMQNVLIEVQDPAKIAIKSDGTTEVVPNVTVNVNAFVILSNRCIDDSKNGRQATPQTEGSTAGSNDVTSESAALSPTPTQGVSEITPGAEETKSSFAGSEDGFVISDQSNTLSDTIDGIPTTEIKTKIVEAEGARKQSRTVVTCVNRAYLFLTEYLNIGKDD